MYATESSTKSNLQAAECFPPSRLRSSSPCLSVCSRFSAVSRPQSGSLGSPTTTCSGLYCGPNRYFRQKSFKSFSCRRLHAEVALNYLFGAGCARACTRRVRGLQSLFHRPIALCATAAPFPACKM